MASDIKIPGRVTQEFRRYAASILGETTWGLSGSEIIDETCKYAARFGVTLKYPQTPKMGPNKRTILAANLESFSDEQAFLVIRELCNHRSVQKHADLPQLKLRLIEHCGDLIVDSVSNEVDPQLIVETISWLCHYPKSKKYYEDGLKKMSVGIFSRNTLDDMRLSLELLLKEVLDNSKSIEKQLPLIGAFVKERGGSPQFVNMLRTLMSCYKDYQNDASKHDDNYEETEVACVVELTSSLMKLFIRFANE
ncbi:hypothetical protein [Rosistilla oblonga]|uniref:hypothetical protein n=1 Tax=Rosistilla oblonga TaxID=2527990 RepID=UPI003A98180A